ncbi:MAG: ADP-ribosylglycohydrolase family protein [Deltaproteobacteria bacterium]|nr:MAG: ADP-ribosylglycohydrolase family protein [Deltaproteobacteria bacterium]
MEYQIIKDKFIGAVLGTFVGDALGRPFEGAPPGKGWTENGEEIERVFSGVYTDDTEMTLILAESLLECKGLDTARLAMRFSRGCHPERGYAWGAIRCLKAIAQGVAWHQAAQIVFPDGSFGNGAAMRVAPVGVFFHDDFYQLRKAAHDQALITHSHPLGVGGAILQAAAIAVATRADPRENPRGETFIESVRGAVGNISKDYLQVLDDVETLLYSDPKPEPLQIALNLGHEVTAPRSVPAALYAFLRSNLSFREVVIGAISLGGDADTIGAMAGAVAGAYHGVSGIPERWMEQLENGERGRDFALGLAESLFELWKLRQKEKNTSLSIGR